MSFSFVDATTGTTSAVLKFEFTGTDTSYSRKRVLRLTIAGTSYSRTDFESDYAGGASSYWTIRVTGLKQNTTYSVSAQLGYYETPSSTTPKMLNEYAKGSFTTEREVVYVAPWSWEKSNGEATTVMTQNASEILDGDRAADDFSHYVWNDLVDKAEEVRLAKGYYWDTVNGTYLSPSACKVNAGDTLSAKVYNSVRYNIGGLEAIGFPDVSPGDEITGYHIKRITEVINKIIATL